MTQYTPHEINDRKIFISGWYMNDTTLCDDLINIWKSSKSKNTGIVGGPHGEPTIDLSKKHSIDYMFKDFNENPIGIRYKQHIKDILNLYAEEYYFVNRMAPMDIVQYPNIQWYPPNGGFKLWHCERSGAPKNSLSTSRNLVFMTYLTDVEEGGETEFYFQHLKIKPEKGLTVMWGSDWTFTHRGVPAPNEEKMIITGWLNYVA